MIITLWGGATSRTLRAHWVLQEAGIEYESELIGSRTGATQTESFTALNGKQKIPVLIDDDFVLTESAAIVTYVLDHYAPDLIPEPRTHLRARYDEWLSFVQMELDAHTLYVIRKHRDLAHLYGEAPAAIETAIEGFNKQVNVAEQRLTDREYLIADRFTGADLMLASCLVWARAYGIALSQPLVEYCDAQTSRPAFKAAREINFSIDAGG